jgi:hypothetical protein
MLNDLRGGGDVHDGETDGENVARPDRWFCSSSTILSLQNEKEKKKSRTEICTEQLGVN